MIMPPSRVDLGGMMVWIKGSLLAKHQRYAVPDEQTAKDEDQVTPGDRGIHHESPLTSGCQPNVNCSAGAYVIPPPAPPGRSGLSTIPHSPVSRNSRSALGFGLLVMSA